MIGRFTTIDRFAEKYSSLNPYQYGALNPISNIDINGDTIFVGSQKVQYTPGSAYKGDDKFVGLIFKTLNKINESKLGGAVLGKLSSSENNFSYTDTYTKDANGSDRKDVLSFEPGKNGNGGEIHAGLVSNMDESQRVEDIAHESFH